MLLGIVSLLLPAVWSPVVDGTTSRFYRISLDPTKPANYSELIKPRPCWLDTHANTAGGVSVDSSGTAITVAWKGAVPQAFRQLAAAQPVTVRFTTARFSSAQLTAEAGRIARTY